MRDTPSFLLGFGTRQPRGLSPAMTVLEYLRTVETLCGTKEGCAEGDCGACTVVLGEADGGVMRYRTVNACILFLPALDGKQLLTVEHLRGADGTPHPVQTAMVAHHASQCGFCTPGFAMSLFALHHTPAPADRTEVNEALAGNLCRCTGYRPIVDAALETAGQGHVTAAGHLAALDTGGMLAMRHGAQAWFAPRSIAELTDILAHHADAVLVAGGTDVGLWVTKQHRTIGTIVALDQVAELTRIQEADGKLQIGAAALYEDLLPRLEALYPDFGALLRRIGSRQIRNRGTIGGNIGNASPIGDTPPVLIALGATVTLRRGGERREISLEDFFLGYRRTALPPGGFIERIDVPLPVSSAQFHCYKVSKRFDQDISAVCAAFNLDLTDGIVRGIRIGFGGMAATPMRAAATERALTGQPWTEAAVRQAMDVLDREFTPLSDMRASAAYRRLAARNLLFKFFLETSAHAPRTRLTVTA